MSRRGDFGCRAEGFTLIELLVAISLMALMAVLSWRGLDGMTRAQVQMRQHSDDVLAVQAGLAQWGSDLDALTTPLYLPNSVQNPDWDGRALRMLRSSTAAPGEGLRVVAWSQRTIEGAGQWLRWQSPPVTTRSDLELAWQKAALWAQSPRAEDRQLEVRVAPIDQWQIFYYRNNAWSNPLSSKDAGTPGTPGTADPATTVPDGVRLVLTLAAGQALSGVVTRDWVRPTLGGRQ